MYFNPDGIPIEKQMAKSCWKAILNVVGHTDQKKEKRILKTFEETQNRERVQFVNQKAEDSEVKFLDFQHTK